MLSEERHAYILNTIEQRKFCSVQTLSREMGVSIATVRRDLQTLAAQKELRLTRGGAMHVQSSTMQEPAYNVKSTLNDEEKARIGAAACQLVHRGEIILLDTGTTVFQMTPGLLAMEDVTVVTNDTRIATELAHCTALNVSVLGGQVRKGYYTTTGFWTLQALESLHTDRCFLSCDSVDLLNGCSITNGEEILIKQRMMDVSNECVLLVDHSKFESVAFLRMCPIKRMNTIITGVELDAKIARAYEDRGVRMLLV